MIIGITGGTGCGKTTALQVFASLGGIVLDCDAIYHHLLATDESLLSAIEQQFPSTVQDGVLDRKKLGSIVFADQKALADLNTITHRAVHKEVLQQITGKTEHIAIDAIGLFESGLASICDHTLAITAPEESRVQRLIRRENISQDYARSRIHAQRPQEEFIALCDHHLENNETEELFRHKCLAFFQGLGIIKK